MKKITLIFVFLFFHSIAIAAEDNRWTGKDTAWQTAYTVLHIADWGQTRYIAKHPERFNERNAILGDHPSTRKVDAYFATTLVAHTAISYVLPVKYRRVWQAVTIAVEGNAVAHNMKIGIKFGF